jgi:outer membrane protein TolC
VAKGFLGRPETSQADLFAQLGREQVNFAKRLLLPNVAIVSSYANTQGSHHPILNAVDGLVASVIFDVPIYDPAGRARVRTAVYAEKASESLRQLLEQLLVLEIEVTALDAQRSLKTLLQTNRAEMLAEEHERAARQAYTRELVPAPTVILAIGVNAFTRVQHLTAMFAYHSARARLNRVTGNREVRYGQ